MTKTEMKLRMRMKIAALDPRILLEDPPKSYHAAHCVTDDDLFNNRVILGDDLLTLNQQA